MMKTKSRAESMLESFDDVISGLIQQMDQAAEQAGGYINRMHPDQFEKDGTKKELSLSEQCHAFLQRRKARKSRI